MKKSLIVAGAVVGLVAVWGIGTRNRIVTQDEEITAAGAQVESVLQRRYDLIPNLVTTVKGYAAHEREVFEDVTRLRSQWGQAGSAVEKAEASTQLEGAIGRLLVVAESYPELKANQGFLALQDELAGTENRIAVERRRYNESVRAFNAYVRRFPNNIVAAAMGMARRDAYAEAEVAAKIPPKVEF